MRLDSEHEIDELAAYVAGFANALHDDRLLRASAWLERLARAGVCGQGYIACYGGPSCGSDHK